MQNYAADKETSSKLQLPLKAFCLSEKRMGMGMEMLMEKGGKEWKWEREREREVVGVGERGREKSSWELVVEVECRQFGILRRFGMLG